MGSSFNLRQLMLLLGIAAAVAVGVVVVLWWRGPNWSLLYGNLADADAANVVQALQTAGIDHKVEDGGAIMVPAERLHDARLKLASQGLPQGKTVGLDMVNKDQGFGVSQFMESARYQYALEGELAQTISSLQAVEAARVHLAIPPQSAFVHDRRPASASVLLQLRSGHRLEASQVSAIVHLVASSISELDADNVTVVDQQGHLLSAPKNSEAAVAAEQFEAAHRVEETYTQRIQQLIEPLVGDGRVRAQVVVDLDSGAQEEAHEQYKPDSAIVRSEQSSEEHSHGGPGSGGVPGSLTNQPPAGGTATAAGAPKPPAPAAGAGGASGKNGQGAAADAAATAAAAAAAAAVPEDSSKQSTKNYEIDRTLSYARQPAGRLKRVSVAVLVDNMHQVGDDGKTTDRALTKDELDGITRLVKDAVGYDESRGDSVNVVNQAFLPHVEETIKPEPVPLWQRPMIRDITRLVLGALVLVALTLGVLRPLIKSVTASLPPPAHAALLPAAESAGAVPGMIPAPVPVLTAIPNAPMPYEQQLVQARAMVAQDPKRVAQVVKTWVGE